MWIKSWPIGRIRPIESTNMKNWRWNRRHAQQPASTSVPGAASGVSSEGADVDLEKKQQDTAAAQTPQEPRSQDGAGKTAGKAAGKSREDTAPQPAGTTPASPASGAPLAPGTRVGSYAIGRLLRDVPALRLYLATLADPSADAEGDPADTRFLLQELPAGASESAGAVEAVAATGLQHPRLLAPRERVSYEQHVFLVLHGLPDSLSIPKVASEGMKLTTIEALRAGAGLADGLSYLHRSGLAHQHVAPDVILMQDERAYLIGLEHAVMLDEPGRDAKALVAADANALARMLGTLARLGTTPPDQASEPEAALRSIVERAAGEGFTTPDEIAATAGAGLLAVPHELPPAGEPATTRVHLRYGLATTVGIVRSENQDAIAAVIFNLVDDAAGQYLPMGVFLVADGMGGEAHGELASRIAARVVPAELLRAYFMPLTIHPALAMTEPELPAPESSTAALTQALGEAVALANRQIRQMAEHFHQDTGSTLTALAVSGAHAIIAHLGDSRAYLLRGGSMVQLTEDHTLLARLQAMDHPILSDSTMYVPRNFLYRSLGQEQAPPDLVELDLAPGDRVLLCSDGLWDEVDDATIQRELARGDDPSRIAERLIEKANSAGGNDNSTALVLFVQASAPDAPPATTRPESAGDAAQQDAAKMDAAQQDAAQQDAAQQDAAQQDAAQQDAAQQEAASEPSAAG